MSCLTTRRRLSEWMDGELPPSVAGRLSAHLGRCRSCARRAAELRRLAVIVAEVPRLEAADPVAQTVLARLEVETRGPGLGLLLRRFGAARPFMVPSLVHAALVVVTILAAAVALDSGGRARPVPALTAWDSVAASGTEGNPLFPSADVGLPHEHDGGRLAADALLATAGEGPLFLETVVARDGTVSTVTVLHGDAVAAAPLLDALRRQTYEPARYQGRPVAVSVYRLISRMEVRLPQT